MQVWGCGVGDVPPPRPCWLQARSLCVTPRPEGRLTRAVWLGMFHGLREVTHARTLIQHPAHGQHAGRSQRMHGRRPGTQVSHRGTVSAGHSASGREGAEESSPPHSQSDRGTARRRQLPKPSQNSPEMMKVSGRRGGRRKPDVRPAGKDATQVKEGRSTRGEETTKPGKKKKRDKEPVAQKNNCRDEDGEAGTSATVRQEFRGTGQNGSERSHHEGTLENITEDDKESTGDEGRYGEAHGHVAAVPETGNPARKPEGAAWEKIPHLLPEASP